MTTKRIVAQFGNEYTLTGALKRLKEKNVKIVDVYGPFATHDILKKVTRESRLPYMAVFYGVMALVAMFSFIYYTAVIDYPLVYGGKPPFSFPPMVVLMFLVCILLTTILTVFTFHGRTLIFPGKPAKIIGPRVTDDLFYLELEQDVNSEEVKGWLREEGAGDITEKEF